MKTEAEITELILKMERQLKKYEAEINNFDRDKPDSVLELFLNLKEAVYRLGAINSLKYILKDNQDDQTI